MSAAQGPGPSVRGCVLSSQTLANSPSYPCHSQLVVSREPRLHLICLNSSKSPLSPRVSALFSSGYFGLFRSPQDVDIIVYAMATEPELTCTKDSSVVLNHDVPKFLPMWESEAASVIIPVIW